MNWKRRIWALAGLLVVAAVATCLVRSRPEPVYQGRPLRSWLKDLEPNPAANGPSTRLAKEAIAALGTNALPGLVAALHNSDAGIRAWMEDVVVECKLPLRFLVREDLQVKALAAFRYLGATAQPAIPELEKMLDQPVNARAAAQALAAVGPEGVARLVRALHRTNAVVRLNAVTALGAAAEPADLMVPALISHLEDADRQVQIGAVEALRSLARVPSVTVPALIQRLNTQDHFLRNRYLNALAAFGPAAKSALPTIVSVYQELPATDLEEEVAALGQIAPETVPATLTEGLRHTNAAVRLNHLKLLQSLSFDLGRYGSEWLQPPLLENLRHPDIAVRRQSARVLQRRWLPDVATQQAIERVVAEGPGAAPANLALPPAGFRFPLPFQKPAPWINCTYSLGGLVRGPVGERKLALEFTGHGFAEGGEVILNALARHQGKASFFLTGDFLDNPQFQPLVQRLVREGHYLGPHSDKHLLYCAWEPDRKLLVTHDQFVWDLWENVAKITRFGVNRSAIKYFLPAYEHYNPQIVDWAGEMKLTLVNYTPGTRSNADYTGEGDKNFVASQRIFESILAREQQDSNGLNGFLLLLHIGAGPGRSDKFHARFGELLDVLAGRGYQFVRLDALLVPPGSRQGLSEESRVAPPVPSMPDPIARRYGLNTQTNGDPLPPVKTNTGPEQ